MEKRIVVLGGGESGCGAAILAKKLGFDVFLSDFGSIADNYKAMLDSHDIPWEERMHTEDSANYEASSESQNQCLLLLGDHQQHPTILTAHTRAVLQQNPFSE